MSDSGHQAQIEQATELLNSVRHVAMATVNEDGSPHNTPLLFIRSDDFAKIYWGSSDESLHTKNIRRDGRVYVVAYDSHTKGSPGVYITAKNAHKLVREELTEGLRAHNVLRVSRGSEPIDPKFYEITSQGLYSADVQKIEIYAMKRGTNGHIEEEVRKEINPKDLLA